MPIYNYRCSDCEEDYEVLAKDDDSIKECIKCGSKNIKRVYSSFDFNFKNKTENSCSGGTCSTGRCGI